MKKILCAVIFALLSGFLPVFSALAAGDMPRLVDGADLLSDSEEAELLAKLDEISERQRLDVVVVTASALEGASAMDFADDFFDYNGYGFGDGRDGVLFLISMEERDWYMSTSGYGITVFTDAAREYMSEKFLGSLSDGDYMAAFTTFADLCDEFITQANTGEPYDVESAPKASFGFMHVASSLLVAFVISLIVTGFMRFQLKSVGSQSSAKSYIKRGGIQVTRRNEMFLYRNVSRREKPKNDSSRSSGGSVTHTSSSGRTHGGGGGKF